MTNREWLNTLTNDELTEGMLVISKPVYYEKGEDGVWYMGCSPDKLYSRLSDIILNTSQSISALREWLDKEHVGQDLVVRECE